MTGQAKMTRNFILVFWPDFAKESKSKPLVKMRFHLVFDKVLKLLKWPNFCYLANFHCHKWPNNAASFVKFDGKKQVFELFVEHDDDDDDEDDEVEVEQEQTEAEKPKQKSESSRRSTNSEAPSRTPSRSPTPRRRSDDEETLEARAMRNLSREASPDESHDSEYEDGQHERDPEPEIEEEEKEELPPYLPSVYGCRNMDEFEVLTIELLGFTSLGTY